MTVSLVFSGCCRSYAIGSTYLRLCKFIPSWRWSIIRIGTGMDAGTDFGMTLLGSRIRPLISVVVCVAGIGCNSCSVACTAIWFWITFDIPLKVRVPMHTSSVFICSGVTFYNFIVIGALYYDFICILGSRPRGWAALSLFASRALFFLKRLRASCDL